MEPTLEQTYTVELTERELGYLYWRMKTNRWYENYVKKRYETNALGALDGRHNRKVRTDI